MKYLFFCLVVLLFNNGLLAQSCLPDGIIFSTQEEIDNFAIDYAGCTQISGNVTIGNNDFPYAIKDLEGLNTLTSIEGKLTIENNDSLRNLAGLDNLHTINGGLAIQFNYLLNSLYGLRNLSELNENLLISVNDSLPNLIGLQGLSLIDGNLIIDNNDGLMSLNGLNNLTEISGDFYIKYNDRLTSLEGLEELTLVQESFHLWYNRTLVNIADLHSLNQVDLLSILGNHNLINLTGLEGITTINNHLEIKHTNISSFFGLNNLTHIGGHLQIHDNAITDFAGFDNLNTVNKYIAVSKNPNLLNFNGLDNLVGIGQHLFIGEHPNLTSLAGLQNLIDINGYLWLRSNLLLDNITALSQIDHTGMTDLRIYGNTNLGFCSTVIVCNYLSDNNTPTATIYNNLTDCSDVETVDTGCSLPIELLTFGAHFQNTQAILTWETATEVNNRGFEIQKSKDAVSWEKIAWMDGAGNSIAPMTYEYVDTEPFRGKSYYRLKQLDFDDEFEYSNIVSVNYLSENNTIYPNPVKDILYVDVSDNRIQNIEVYDYTGKIILKNTNTDNIRVAGLPEGIYSVKITTSNDYYHTKFIKQSP